MPRISPPASVAPHTTGRDRLDAPIYDDDLPDPLPQPALDQQRHVQHAHPLAPPPAAQYAPEHLPAHRRVDDAVQRPPLVLVREDDAAELRAVEAAVGEEDVRPECAHDLRERGRARLDDLAREHVCVDDGQVVGAEQGGDCGFSGRDSAGEADDCRSQCVPGEGGEGAMDDVCSGCGGEALECVQ